MSSDPRPKGEGNPKRIKDLLEAFSKELLRIELPASAAPRGDPPSIEPFKQFQTLGPGLTEFVREMGDKSSQGHRAIRDLRDSIDRELAELSGGRGETPGVETSPPSACAPLPCARAASPTMGAARDLAAPAGGAGAPAQSASTGGPQFKQAKPQSISAKRIVAVSLFSAVVALIAVSLRGTPPKLLSMVRNASLSSRPTSKALALPIDHTVGLFRRDRLWLSVNWMDGQIFALDETSGRLKYARPFPNTFTTGLSAGLDCLWSVDGYKLKLYKHHPETFDVMASAPAPGSAPGAVHWDGHSLWLADKKSRIVRRYVNGDLATSTEYKLLDEAPVGLWRAENLLWVLDGARKTIRRYQADPRFQAVDLTDLSEWLTPEAKPTGFAVYGPELWLMTNNPAFLYNQPLKFISWRKAAD